MLLLDFLLTEGGASRRRLLAGAFAASLGSVALLVAVNRAAAEIARSGEDRVDWVLALVFVLSALLYFAAERDLIARVGAATEQAIARVRGRLIDGVRHAEFVGIERLGSALLFESITQSSGVLSQNSQFVALSLRSAVLTALVLLYILTLSLPAFLLVAAGTLAAGLLYRRLGGALARRYEAMMAVERQLFRAVGDLLDGHREVRLSRRRSAELAADFERIAARSTALRIAVQERAFRQLIFGHVAFFFLLAVVVFVAPSYTRWFAGDVAKICAAVIFMIGPLGGVIQAVAVLASADAAIRRIRELDGRLRAIAEPAAADSPGAAAPGFAEIRLHGVLHAYPAAPGETAFTVGPLDLVIRRGEVIFVTGGNGSGKSTFIKLLTGLYRPVHGHVACDGVPVGDAGRAAYRERFAAVFSDFHLFPRRHGAPPAGPEAADLLDWLEIGHLVRLDGDAFSRTDLSTGQRKRLALVSALLEARPLLILDEWAADQDPHFRRKFYREILPALKARGLTIIAVTHDDHYFDVADRRLHFEEGRMRELPPAAVAPAGGGG